MAGEVRKLGKAIAVVRKAAQREGAGDESGMEGEVEVEEILRWKIVFGNRPEPMGAEQKLVGGAGAVDEGVEGGGVC